MELRVTHSATRSVVSALIIGDGADAHFRAGVAWLDASANCQFAADVADALDTRDAVCPMLVVLLQSRPGQFAEAELDALRSRWPLARIVGIYGSWSEGEPRNGPAASGVYRIAWHAAIARLSEALERAPQSRLTTRRAAHTGHLFDLPPTATADERLLASAGAMSSERRTIAVAAVRASYAEPLVDALAAAGNAAFYWPLDGRLIARGIDAVVWDTFGCEHDLERFRAMLHGAKDKTPVVATMDFLRPQDTARLAELGVVNALGKPLLVTDLLTCLEAVCAYGAEGELPRFAVA